MKRGCQRLALHRNRASEFICVIRFPQKEIFSEGNFLCNRETKRQGRRLICPLKSNTRVLWATGYTVPFLSCIFLFMPDRVTTFNRRSSVTSDLEVIFGNSRPFVRNSFFLHRPVFIGACYRPLASDILPALLPVFR